MRTHKPVLVVQGAQFGSEAKGAIAAYLCVNRKVDYAVRTGAINAGHTVIYGGERYAMQQLPVGWVNPNTQLVIGPGAYIHPETLWREVDMVNRAMPEADVRDRLYIDYRCGIHDAGAEGAAKDANRHHRIGATGKGCSEAIVAKIRNRNDGYELWANTGSGADFRIRNKGHVTDTVALINKAYDSGQQVLLEGTQGTLLDLHLGPYPFTTSRMTTAANWVAEAGLSPSLDYEIVLVVRTYPIRVAGNSGPMSNEIEWTDLAREINDKLFRAGMPMAVDDAALREFEANLDLAASQAILQNRYKVPVATIGKAFRTRLSQWTKEERSTYRVAASELHRDALMLCKPETLVELRKMFEMTTVTKKLRRLARMHMPDLRMSVQVNRPAWIAMTFMDYEFPELAGATVSVAMQPAAAVKARYFTAKIEDELGVPVRLASFGPNMDNVFEPAHLFAERAV